jgi:branched-chain amino acid aminotransferase
MHEHIFHNDRVLPLAQGRLSPGQSGLLSGWGIFTTIRIYQGQAFAFERHWNRLHRDAERIHLPFDFSSQAVNEALRQVIEANAVSEGCARIYFVNNKAGFWSSNEPGPPTDLLIFTSDLPVFPALTKLALQENGRHAAHPLAGTKVISWLHNVWSLDQARRRGFDEVILLNERGELTECTAANLFCVEAGRVTTPPLSSGCLAGVTREVLLEIAAQIKLPMQEKTLRVNELHEAEEVFITSTSREILPVRQIEDHRVPLSPGPVTARLSKAFSDYLADYFSRSAKPARS